MRNFLFPALLALPLAAALPAQDMLAVSWSGGVYLLDSFTGTSTYVGVGLMGQNALTRDDSGTVWSTRRVGSSTYGVTTIDPTTGAAVEVYSNTTDIRGMAPAGGGMLYIVEQTSGDTLSLFDTTTGVSTPIGGINFGGVQSLAQVDGQLYAWDVNYGLLSIDAATGAGTDIVPGLHPGNESIQWLARRGDGKLVGGNDELYELDPATGAVTLIGGSFADLRGAEPLFDFTQHFGAGCDGEGGQVTSTATIGGGVGSNLTLQSTNHAANAIGIVIFGASGGPGAAGGVLPLLLDPIFGTQNCWLQVSPDVSIATITSGTFPATLDLDVPILAGWPGFSLFVQHAVLENVPGGLSLSDGIMVQFGY